MANTFKYAEMAEGTPNAAQEFLKQQLSKNRYTKEQAERLDASGGATIGAGGEGIIGQGALYDAQNPTKVANAKAASAAKTKMDYADMPNIDQLAEGRALYRYREGQWGSGKYSKEELAEKFGLDTTAKENRGESAMWGLNRNGEEVFLGNINNVSRGNSELISAHAAQSFNEDTGSLSSSGDVKGALRNLWDGGGETTAAPAQIEEEPNKPIEYSDEIKQAVNRVRSYENDVLSGKTSQEIYGDNNNEQNDNKYVFDMNKGIDGIGTEGSIIDSDTASKSTENFLQSKKTDIMKKYQFKAA